MGLARRRGLFRPGVLGALAVLALPACQSDLSDLSLQAHLAVPAVLVVPSRPACLKDPFPPRVLAHRRDLAVRPLRLARVGL